MITQKVDLSTVVSGRVDVTIEEVGTFGMVSFPISLQRYAGSAYVYLTGRPLLDRGDFFEFVSFNIIDGKGKLVVKVNNKV